MNLLLIISFVLVITTKSLNNGHSNGAKPATPIVATQSLCPGAWEQCGGKGYTGKTCCPDGFSCIYFNEWWSECKPPSDPSAPRGPIDPLPPRQADIIQDGCKLEYGQCAGLGYNGPKCCITGLNCVSISEWWGECKKPTPAPSPVIETPSIIIEEIPKPPALVTYSQQKSGDAASVVIRPSLPCKGAWTQCGGLEYRGSNCCISGYECVAYSQWFAECQPIIPAVV